MKIAAFCAAISLASTTLGSLLPINTPGGVAGLLLIALAAFFGGLLFEGLDK